MKTDLLKNKKILIVDDEPDILDIIEDSLDMCEVQKAADFKKGKELLEKESFDIAILDIMGVNGYELLDIANQRKILTIMLTAHALSPDHTIKSYKRGAAYYVPKEKINDIKTYLNDVLETRMAGRSRWSRWVKRFLDYYDDKFGPKWRDADADFWKKLGEVE